MTNKNNFNAIKQLTILHLDILVSGQGLATWSQTLMSQQRLNVVSNGLNSKSSMRVGKDGLSICVCIINCTGKPGVKSADDVVIVW